MFQVKVSFGLTLKAYEWPPTRNSWKVPAFHHSYLLDFRMNTYHKPLRPWILLRHIHPSQTCLIIWSKIYRWASIMLLQTLRMTVDSTKSSRKFLYEILPTKSRAGIRVECTIPITGRNRIRGNWVTYFRLYFFKCLDYHDYVLIINTLFANQSFFCSELVRDGIADFFPFEIRLNLSQKLTWMYRI